MMLDESGRKGSVSAGLRALWWLLAACILAVAAGCDGAGETGTAASVAAATSESEQHDLSGFRFRCGDALVVLRPLADDAADLLMGMASYRMQREPAASGVRYVATGTELVSFWDKGDRALLSIGGETLPECRREGTGEVKPAAVDPEAIVGMTWLLEDLNHRGIIDSSHLTLQFTADGSITGSAGCNQYRGRYSLLDGRLEIAPNIAATRKACAPALMNQEQEYLRLLPEMREIHIDHTGALILSNRDGSQLLFRVEG